MRDIGDALIKAGDYKGAAAFYNSSTEILQSVKPENFEKPAIEVDPDELGPDEQVAVLNTLGVTEASGQPGATGEGSGSGTAGAEGSPSGGGGDGREGGGNGGDGRDGNGGGEAAGSGEGDGPDRDTGPVRFGAGDRRIDFFARMFGLLGHPASPGRDTGDPLGATNEAAGTAVQGSRGAIVAIVWKGSVDPSPESDTAIPKLRGRPFVPRGDTGFRDPIPVQLNRLSITSQRFAP